MVEETWMDTTNQGRSADLLKFRLYGYPAGVAAENPLALDEVTVSACPTSLRSMAAFFQHVAALMETHGDAFGHEHLADFVADCGDSPSLVITRIQDRRTDTADEC